MSAPAQRPPAGAPAAGAGAGVGAGPEAPRPLPDREAGLATIKAAVRALPPYAPSRPTALRRLDQNEAPWDCPPALKAEVLARLEAVEWHRYPDAAPERLRVRLAEHYGWRADGVLVGNGSDELIAAVLAAVLAEGDAVVTPVPTYSLFQRLAGAAGARHVGVPLGLDYAYDVEAIVRAARRERARVVVLVSPNNPTGSAMPPDAVLRVLSATDALVLVDETYQEFGGPSAVPLLARSSRVVVLRTLAKALGLAALRCGVALAHPAVAAEIAKVRPPHGVSPTTLAAADVALDHLALVAERTQRLVEARDLAEARLQLLPGIAVHPSAANFFLVRCVALPAREIARRLLAEDGILVREFSGAQGLADCLRISVGTAEDMDAVVAGLTRIVTTAGARP